MTKHKEREEDIVEIKNSKREEDVEAAVMEPATSEVAVSEEDLSKERELTETEKLEKQSQEHLDGWKRCLADFENFRKQQEARQAEFRKFAVADLISQILPILDNFHTSTDHIPEDQKENLWVVGIMHIQKQLEGVLKDNGVEEIITKVGDQFDHNIHEAVADQKQQDTSDKKDKNKITKIASKGYRIDGKVIRPARVVVN